MDVLELETPSVLIDIARVEANIERMQAHCASLGLAFRPHVKTHKVPEIAWMQLEAGAAGIACQKVSEAEIFAQTGISDIQIPYNILGSKKTERLANLALFTRMTVSADSAKVIAGLADAARAHGVSLRVLVELATDLQRTGCSVDEVVPLAQQVEAAENLHFAGLLVYPSYATVRPLIQEAIARLAAVGIGVDTVSGGGIGASHVAVGIPELTELRVGTYVFNDWTTVVHGWAALDDCAMHVASTVVSRPTPDRAILDSGSKTLSSEVLDRGYGYILEYPQASIYRLNEEHAYVDLSRCDERPDIGERIHVVPVHACVVTNLHNTLYGVRGSAVEAEWKVAARGAVW